MSLLIFLMQILREMVTYCLILPMLMVFWLSGIFFNLLHLLLYISLYSTNRRMYRKLGYFLVFWSYSQIICLYEWRTNSSCNLYGTPEHLNKFGKEHCLVVMNHKHDIDWMIAGYVCNHLRMLGGLKGCAKKLLRYIPVVGWGGAFAENIFLERNWEKDKLSLGDQLDKLASYEDPIMFYHLCEGTRFTPEKHKTSVEFAKARNLAPLRHHLFPRTKGFNFTVKHLKGKIPAIYNVQLAFPETEVKPTFVNLLKGHSFTADYYLERIALDEVPTDSDEDTSKWVYELYQRKDKLMDDYLKTQKFPGECRKITRSYRTLVNSVFWGTLIGVPGLYFIFLVISKGNMFLCQIVFTIFLLLLSVQLYIVQTSKADKSSSYGTHNDSAESNENGSRKEKEDPIGKTTVKTQEKNTASKRAN